MKKLLLALLIVGMTTLSYAADRFFDENLINHEVVIDFSKVLSQKADNILMAGSGIIKFECMFSTEQEINTGVPLTSGFGSE